jgi:flagellar hook protein FlgE
MGIFGALTTAVTGMRAQSYALENISGNIANSQTTAFKRIDTAFRDLIPDMGNLHGRERIGPGRRRTGGRTQCLRHRCPFGPPRGR